MSSIHKSLTLFCIMLILTRLSQLDAADTTCDPDDPKPPPDFPSSIELTLRTFNNWADIIIVPNLWTAIPNTPTEVVTIVNWAVANGYTVRATGFMHTWSPVTVTNSNSTCPKILLVSTQEHFTQMKILSDSPNAAVWTQTGISMEKLLAFLEEKGYAVQGTPAPGDLSVGGVITVGGHGGGIRVSGKNRTNGFTYGSISNLVLSFTAIVWDNVTKEYVLKTFDRSDEDAGALIISLGRTFLADVTLRIGPNYNLRCLSTTDIPASELFADPFDPNNTITEKTRTYTRFLELGGRVETIWFPHSDNPWIKIWTVTPIKPKESRGVKEPFNYPFSDLIPAFGSHFTEILLEGVSFALFHYLASRLLNNSYCTMTETLTDVGNAKFLSPAFGQMKLDLIRNGLKLTESEDIWGPSKNHLLYVRPTTLRLTANGYAVITARVNVQLLLSKMVRKFKDLLNEYRQIGRFPANGAFEFRVSGLDDPDDIGLAGARSLSLSVIKPVKGHPELDVAIWMDILSFPTTPFLNKFMREFEEFMLTEIHDGRTAIVRPEWSKGWGYTEESAWTNMTIIKKFIPKLYKSNDKNEGWNWAISTLRKYDPFNIFLNDFLDELFVKP